MATAIRPPTHVLVVQTSYLGDVVLSTPVFVELKRQWPATHLTVLVRPDAAPILRGHEAIDRVWVFDKRGGDSGIRGILRMARRLRETPFDLALGLQKSWRTAILLALARVPVRAGFRDGAGRRLYHYLAAADPARHSVERHLAVLGPLGVECDAAGARPSLAVADEARSELQRRLRECSFETGKRYAVLAPGSAWATKRWKTDGYAAVARALGQEGYGIVFVGAPSERTTLEAVCRAAGGGAVLAGDADTAVLAAAIEAAAVLICNDSAPMHIAQALGVPVVAVFGPTSPTQGFGPRWPPALVVEREGLSCRPCSRHGGDRCPIGTHECMSEIAPSRVLDAVKVVCAQGLNSGVRIRAC